MRQFYGILLGIVALLYATSYVAKYFFHDAAFDVKQMVKIIQRCLMIIVILFALRTVLYEKFKYNKIIVPICILLLGLSYNKIANAIDTQNLEISSLSNSLFLIGSLATGLLEELLFRVYAFKKHFHLTKQKSLIKSILVATTLFAVVHAFNLLNPATHTFSAISQIIFAFGIGLIFQGLYIRFKNIILIAVLHGLVNYLGAYRSKLFFLPPEDSSEYTMTDFYTTVAFMLGFVFLIATPTCYLLIKKELDKLKQAT